MTVYVDDMRAPYGRMIMCHMISDTEDELHTMAQWIGVARRWHQGNHYDICLIKRDMALRRGAVPVTKRQAAAMVYNARHNVPMDPATAEDMMRGNIKKLLMTPVDVVLEKRPSDQEWEPRIIDSEEQQTLTELFGTHKDG